MLKLALHGERFSGKTYLAHELEKRGFQLLDYTGLLKRYLSEALAAIGVDIPVVELLANKEKYRKLIIEFGIAIGFDQGFGVDRMLAEINPSATGVVFDNVRFPAQWDMLKAEGFTLLRLVTQDQHRAARGMAVGVTTAELLAFRDDEATERPLPLQDGEIQVHQAGPIDDVIADLLVQVATQAHAAWVSDPGLDRRISTYVQPVPTAGATAQATLTVGKPKRAK